ncbi:hypothetical protein CLV81_2533 [Flagellimonas meridianipacifica]|uniref:Uncharacterized protein n=1 Tax=Flagellimonas meridianipacifica TaxID=1080225 RepID=A0A2T0M9C4_9FLAO|nr:hypothetical protein CLV81_2533 [Allomuricauda pacifica]
MDYTIYIILGGLVIVYFVVFFTNKRGQKRRKSRKFMDGKRRHNEQ